MCTKLLVELLGALSPADALARKIAEKLDTAIHLGGSDLEKVNK